MITVVNQKQIRGRKIGGEKVYIGRWHEEFGFASPLANPYHIGRDGDRAEVIEKYRRWLGKQVKNQHSAAYQELVRLAEMAEHTDLTLICWCKKPGREIGCHGDVVKRAIEWMREQLRRGTQAPPPPEEPSSNEPGHSSLSGEVPLALMTAATLHPVKPTPHPL